MKVEVKFEPSDSFTSDPSPTLILGEPHVEPIRYCAVCSAENGMEIVHTGPPCEEGKPAVSRQATPEFIAAMKGESKS